MGASAHRNHNPGNVIPDIKKGLTALIMIADSNREWAAWYYYQSKSEMDMQTIGNYYPEILGEVTKYPTHFATTAPTKIDELCGTDEAKPFRVAALVGTKHDVGQNIIELQLFVQKGVAGKGPMNEISTRPTVHPIRLHFERKAGTSNPRDYPIGFGWLHYTGIYEAYNFLWPYHSKSEKLQSLESMMLHRGSPEFRVGI
jgi:hypothetical protein